MCVWWITVVPLLTKASTYDIFRLWNASEWNDLSGFYMVQDNSGRQSGWSWGVMMHDSDVDCCENVATVIPSTQIKTVIEKFHKVSNLLNGITQKKCH